MLTRLGLFLLASASICLPDTIVMPPAYTSTEGPTSTALSAAAQFQEVLSGSLFGALGPIEITGISVRPDAANVAFTGSTTVTITLSTTLVSPDSLSPTFANNVGTNLVTVFSAPYVFNTSNSGAPKAFDIAIPFSTPYTYDPSSGMNLVFDITTAGTVGSAGHDLRLDSAFLIPTGSGVGSVLAPLGNTVGGVFTGGLIGEFAYTPVGVPEPAPLGLIGMGILALAGWARQRR